jgi:uncharacterized membrane protein
LPKLGVVNVTKLGFGCQQQTNNWKKLRMTEPEEQTGHTSRELDRIVFFSDAVFAIAITLLVLNIEVPDIPQGRVAQELPGQLLALWPKYFSYFISFLVILSFWMAHHSIFSHVKDYDRSLMWLNSLFLMCVAFLPFPSALLGEYGEQWLVVMIYAASLGITRLPLSAAWWYVHDKPHLIQLDVAPATLRMIHLRALYIPLVFLLSIGISFFSVRAAVYSWILLFVGDSVVLYILRRFRSSRREPGV